MYGTIFGSPKAQHHSRKPPLKIKIYHTRKSLSITQLGYIEMGNATKTSKQGNDLDMVYPKQVADPIIPQNNSTITTLSDKNTLKQGNDPEHALCKK